MEHLKTLSLENFRLFKNKTVFNFAPITFLVGTNNSGKSSLIKAIKLLKGSFEQSDKFSDLLFSKGNHNLGTFLNTLNKDSDSNEMVFTLKIPDITSNLFFEDDIFIELVFAPNKNFEENGILITRFKIFTPDETIVDYNSPVKAQGYYKDYSIFVDDSNEWISILKINLEYFFEKYKRLGDLIKQFQLEKSKSSSIENIFEVENDDEYDLSLVNSYNSVFYSFYHKIKKDIDDNLYNLNEFTFSDNIVDLFEISDSLKNEKNYTDKILKYIKKIKETGYVKGYEPVTEVEIKLVNPDTEFGWFLEHFHDFFDSIFGISSDYSFSELGKFVLRDFENLISQTFKKFDNQFQNINTLSSIRGNTMRLYDNNSNSVDINSIIFDFLKLTPIQSKKIKRFIEFSLKLFGIADSIEINRVQGVASEIFAIKNKNKILLADLGFGYTQLIPIILKIAILAKQNERFFDPDLFESYLPSVLILEEPESNLHPALQSKLADLLIEAGTKFNIQFIVETHSEYFIRRMQFLVASNHFKGKMENIPQIESRDVKIFYFNENKNIKKNDEQVFEINIQNDGSLSRQFGDGFYDVVDKIALELFWLKNQPQN